jgi:hypothetical protein
MRRRLWWRASVLCGASCVLSLSVLSIQLGGQGKRPLTYDTYDAWKSIQGTTLSRDGRWLAYAVTAQALDGELIVRNLESGQELRHARGINPEFTPDGRFVVFAIVPTKAEEERQREAERRAGGRGRGRGEAQANQPRNAAGIMNLATGQVSTVERIGTISLAEESSAWVALHRGTAAPAAPDGEAEAGAAPGAPAVPPRPRPRRPRRTRRPRTRPPDPADSRRRPARANRARPARRARNARIPAAISSCATSRPGRT